LNCQICDKRYNDYPLCRLWGNTAYVKNVKNLKRQECPNKTVGMP